MALPAGCTVLRLLPPLNLTPAEADEAVSAVAAVLGSGMSDNDRVDRDRSVDLLQGLVAIPSLSRYERNASEWLTGQMEDLGLERCRVDEVGNVIGEIGDETATRWVVLLGHIDTVEGEIRVRIEDEAGVPTLWGRGSVDAKGPLATFTAAVARLGHDWACENDIRVVVIGAVEEESATSRGARHVRDVLFADRSPDACIIGEPSAWDRVTLGYKGRLLLDLEARRPLTHTAGPDPGIATVATTLWNAVDDHCQAFNGSHDKVFDLLLPSLRSLDTESDGLTEVARATIGHSPAAGLRCRWTGRTPPGPRPGPIGLEAPRAEATHLLPTASMGCCDSRAGSAIDFAFRGYEPRLAQRPRNALVRSFLGAIRSLGPPDTKPRFVVKTGTSDMNVVAPVWRCPILAYGPGDSAFDHTPVERLSLDEYWLAIGVLEEALRQIAEAPTLEAAGR